MKSIYSFSLWFQSGTMGITQVENVQQVFKSDFVHKVAQTFSTRILLIAIGLTTSVLTARILGPEGRGLYAAAIAIGAIGIQFGNLGLHASNTYYVAQDCKLLAPLIGNALLIGLVGGFLLTIIAGTLCAIYPNLIPVSGILLFLVLGSVPLGLTNLLLDNLLIGLQDIRAHNTIIIVSKMLAVFLILMVMISSLVTVESVYITGIIALIVSLFWTLQRLKSHLNSVLRLSFNLIRKGVRYGFKAYLAALFAFLVIRLDLIMVQHILGAEQAGYYSIAATMAEMFYMLPVAIGTILFPTLSAMAGRRQKWIYTKKVAAVTGFFMLVLAIPVLLLASIAVDILYGQAFLPSVTAFHWLIPAIIFLSVNTIFMNFFASIGMPIITVISPLLAVVVNVVLNLIFLPLYGIYGASLSSIAAYGIMLLISILYIFNFYLRKNVNDK